MATSSGSQKKEQGRPARVEEVQAFLVNPGKRGGTYQNDQIVEIPIAQLLISTGIKKKGK